jgi:HK97 family phage portal protein
VRNPFKREKALTATPAVLDALRDDQWAPYPLLGGGSRQRIVEAFNTAQSANFSWIYRRSPAVRKVVDVIVRNIGQLDLRLYEEVSEAERQPMPDHPAALSLRYPSENVSQDKFLRSLVKDFLLFDNAYALLTPAAGGQISLNRMPAHMVEVMGASLFTAEGYRLHRRDGTFADLSPDQVLHWSGENPDDPRVGVSRLETLRDVIAEDVALRQATIELANSGLTEPVWVYRPPDAPEITPTVVHKFEEDLTNRVKRRNSRIPLLEEGMELRSFGVSPHDAQMMEMRRWATSEIAGVYGLPLGMVGLADDLDQARSEFYADTLPPYCEDMTKMLTQRILVRVYDWPEGCFELNLDEKHMGDDRLKSLVSATGRPVLTTNEGRAMVNRPPIDGGDELVTPLNVIVGENPKPSPQIMGPQDPNGPPQDGSYRPDQPAKGLKAAEEFTPVPQLVPSRKADLDRQFRNIDKAQAVIERHFGRLERSLKGKKAAADWDRWDRELAADLNTLVSDIVENEGTIYAFKLGGVFEMGRVLHYLKAMAEGAAEAINAKIRDEIDSLGFDGAFARRSAHVESAGAGLGAGATRWAREEAARQSPDTERRVKVWIPDTQRHAEFGGDTVPLSGEWPAGFAPGSAPGCKCSMAIQ